jgi:hypothetical protein
MVRGAEEEESEGTGINRLEMSSLGGNSICRVCKGLLKLECEYEGQARGNLPF